MGIRKIRFSQDGIYHICAKSISSMEIFKDMIDYKRMREALEFFLTGKALYKFSLRNQIKEKVSSISINNDSLSDKLVDILAYCLMPTHIHLILREHQNGGISRFMQLILLSHAKYFNTKYERRGPVWCGRFKGFLVENDHHFLHLTRYIHLNPVTSRITEKPEDWLFSSYKEYVNAAGKDMGLCIYSDCFDMDADHYRKFVYDRISYQRELALIKYLISSAD